MKFAHPGETFRIIPVEECLCNVGPSLDNQARKRRIEPVKRSIRPEDNRNASEINTFIEPVRIHTTPSRAKRVSAFECFIIDDRWWDFLIKKLRGIPFLSFFAQCGVIIGVIQIIHE